MGFYCLLIEEMNGLNPRFTLAALMIDTEGVFDKESPPPTLENIGAYNVPRE